jgi:hypothetical protein
LYSLDLALKTKEGYFIVKDFKDKIVTLEDLKQLILVISNKFKDKYQRTFVFRVLCVAKEYDQPLLQQESLERQMTEELKKKF